MGNKVKIWNLGEPCKEVSHEQILRTMSKQLGVHARGDTLRSKSAVKENVDALARLLLSGDCLERLVGSSCYLIETEFQSHCSVCNLSEQFDLVLHVGQVARTSQ